MWFTKKTKGTLEWSSKVKMTTSLSQEIEITLPEEEKQVLTKYYAQASTILEYGSGGSTLFASSLKEKKIISVESDRRWAEHVKGVSRKLNVPSFPEVISVDIGRTGDWGRPLDAENWNSFINYVLAPWQSFPELQPDVIFIDGRFRTACLAFSLLRIKSRTIILFDDYKSRRHYWKVESIVKPKAIVGRMAVFDIDPIDSSILPWNDVIKLFFNTSPKDKELLTAEKGLLRAQLAKIEAKMTSLQSERENLKATVANLHARTKQHKIKYRKLMKLALIFSAPTLLLLSPIILPMIIFRRALRKSSRLRINPIKRIKVLQTQLLALGFTDSPLSELMAIARTSKDSKARALAAQELALWYMRTKTTKDLTNALEWLSRARSDAPDTSFRAKVLAIELLCRYHLGDVEGALSVFDDAALRGDVTDDVLLARANFEALPEKRIEWINFNLERYKIEPIKLLPKNGLPPYDRLSCAIDLPKVESGPKVTVLVAAFESAKTLPTALRSLQAQTWTNLEIIVIDDCSPKMDTFEIAKQIAALDPRIKVVRMTKNRGAYVARNRGLDIATGEFVTLHDADDWSHPQKIEKQLQFLLTYPKVMGCTSEQTRVTEDLSFTKLRGRHHCFKTLNSSSLMWRRRQVFEKLGYWDTVRFGADTEFMRRMQIAFGKKSVVHIETGNLSFQRQAERSITSDPIMGVGTMLYGVRREYNHAYTWHHRVSNSIKYDGNPKVRPFPVPSMMLPDRDEINRSDMVFDSVIFCDFRSGSKFHDWGKKMIEREVERGSKVGLVQYECLDYLKYPIEISDEIRDLCDGENVQILVYGDEVTCKRVHCSHSEINSHEKRLKARVTQLGES